jgi:hypothetical protein
VKFLDRLKGVVLGFADFLNANVHPFDKFSRPLQQDDPSSLKDKAIFFSKDIEDNWMHGPKNEFYHYAWPNDMGDMAIWHGVYVAMCAFRQHTEPSKANEASLNKAMDGLARLQILGNDNRLARGADAVESPFKDWRSPDRTYYTEGDYIFIDDVSESSLIGHMLGLWAVQNTSATVTSKILSKALTAELADQVIRDGYRLLNKDGTAAKYGNLQPNIATAPIRLASLCCLLLLASKGKRPEYYNRYVEIYNEFKSTVLHPETHFLWIHPAYQDILAYMILFMMASLEDDKGRKEELVDSLKRQWSKNKEEGNVFYTYMVQKFHDVGKNYLDIAKQVLREFSTKTGRVGYEVINSNRDDIKIVSWGFGSKKKTSAAQPLPVWQRPAEDFFWQRDPRALDGHIGWRPWGYSKFNRLDYLVAYYLGKFLKIL